jgi:hypothetical protein
MYFGYEIDPDSPRPTFGSSSVRLCLAGPGGAWQGPAGPGRGVVAEFFGSVFVQRTFSRSLHFETESNQ